MYKIPISLVTIFHPDKIWKLNNEELEKLPSLKKDRIMQELLKEKIAKENNLKLTKKEMHRRKINNFGSAEEWFRYNWLEGKELFNILSDYSIRLIDTLETGSQTRWKIEARPNWGNEPNSLSNHLTHQLRDFFLRSKISVRQFWINPFTFDYKDDIQGPFYESGYTANLVLGPYDPECIREAKMNFIKQSSLLSLHEHRPFYRETLISKEIKILPNSCFWWAEYEKINKK